jgi:hypothetical protein
MKDKRVWIWSAIIGLFAGLSIGYGVTTIIQALLS